ncbi:periplasmic binding protein [Pyrobaculum islandicum DSM 4184]|uniref:Periplasmic binding protein n=1 Tax=Pyrobaculum islandicum (strain DSM 4184 / JCM 9189 / GEO3) TaxID=384616 RepID=A1RQL1_PYRIL|nr:ABC transporter substrate-binding protein [Pyrobaculum islandicum]ABL87243.1 periplasmic binding protein [Pyrobaculum islandicum DSM 4184]
MRRAVLIGALILVTIAFLLQIQQPPQKMQETAATTATPPLKSPEAAAPGATATKACSGSPLGYVAPTLVKVVKDAAAAAGLGTEGIQSVGSVEGLRRIQGGAKPDLFGSVDIELRPDAERAGALQTYSLGRFKLALVCRAPTTLEELASAKTVFPDPNKAPIGYRELAAAWMLSRDLGVNLTAKYTALGVRFVYNGTLYVYIPSSLPNTEAVDVAPNLDGSWAKFEAGAGRCMFAYVPFLLGKGLQLRPAGGGTSYWEPYTAEAGGRTYYVYVFKPPYDFAEDPPIKAVAVLLGPPVKTIRVGHFEAFVASYTELGNCVIESLKKMDLSKYGFITTARATAGASKSAVVEVVDVLGRRVSVKAPVSRVVALGPGALRLVVYLNATDKLAGIEEIEKRPPRGRDYGYILWTKNLTSLPVVGRGGPGSPVDYERILSVRPDVIIMSPLVADAPDKIQEKTGIPVVVVSAFIDSGEGWVNFTSLYKSLRTVGVLLGREERAEELVRYMEGLIKDLKRRTANITQRPKVYVGAISYKGGQPFEATQSYFPPLVLLNTPGVADRYGIKGVAKIDWEALLKEQPDVIFIDLGNYMFVVQDFNKSRDKYCALKAFREGRVYGILMYNWYGTNIATLFADAYFMGKVLYPEAFRDVDPVAKADEIYREFLGTPLYTAIAKDFKGGFRQLTEFKCGS